MAALSGKRKRFASSEVKQENILDKNQSRLYRKLLQQHFEASYAPLDTEKVTEAVEDGFHSSEDIPSTVEGDWEGFSDEEIAEMVDVTKHDSRESADIGWKSRERRYFMSNKPPSAAGAKPSTSLSRRDQAEEDAVEAANLKNDLALQRLLQESSLLHKARSDARGTMPSAVHPMDQSNSDVFTLQGTDRHKALDLRLQRLGAKESLFKQKKMPLSHRFGIVEKQRAADKDRRREARENGVVLERGTETKRDNERRKRTGGVGGPGVGKMKGGTLFLSRKDVKEINGTGTTGRRR